MDGRMSNESNNNSNGGGCGCVSLIVFALLVMFGYYSCTQKSFYGGAAVMKTKYEHFRNKIDSTQTKLNTPMVDSCTAEWTKINGEWIKTCK